MNTIKRIILKTPIIQQIALFFRWIFKSFFLFLHTRKRLVAIKSDQCRIFYIGIPAHANLGDLAQGVCIRKWLRKHYPEREIIEIETNALVNTPFSLLPLLKKLYKKNDFIVFQSGYTTTDLGGFADEMHRAVIKTLPHARFLMLPQTIFFKSDTNKKRTSASYNSAEKMLYLARDTISFEQAKEMFPDIPVELYPDIVTTLIGSREYANARKGIMFCCRNDGEKYYSDEEIDDLMHMCKDLCDVSKTDTTKCGQVAQIVANAEQYINQEIEEYAKYRLIITDRYHGTILSLVAGTPVVIIKTTDHKVTTGAAWFKGVYDSHVYLAEDLDDAYKMAKDILARDIEYKLEPYFEREFYDRLPKLFADKTLGV